MPVDPILEPLLPNLPPLPEEIDDFHAFRTQGTEAGNAMIDQLTEPAPEGAHRRIVQIPVDDGSIRPARLHPLHPRPPSRAPVPPRWRLDRRVDQGQVHRHRLQRTSRPGRLRRRHRRIPQSPRAQVPHRTQRLLHRPAVGRRPRRRAPPHRTHHHRRRISRSQPRRGSRPQGPRRKRPSTDPTDPRSTGPRPDALRTVHRTQLHRLRPDRRGHHPLRRLLPRLTRAGPGPLRLTTTG